MANEDAGMSLSGTITATLENRAPRARFTAPEVVECSAPRAGYVTVDGTATTDPDGNLRDLLWYVDGNPAGIRGQNSTQLRAPLGQHNLGLIAVDTENESDTANRTVMVVDTIPPQLSDFAFSGPVCLSPPNHKYVVLRVGQEFGALVQDTCDPMAHLEILSAESTQPDNDIGDGDTRNDIVVFPDYICIRSERQGTDYEARTYRVQLGAVDAAGNTSDPIVYIRVTHDQSDHDCPQLEPSVFVEDGDPLCMPIASKMMTSNSTSFGCHSMKSHGTRTAFLLTFVVIILRRRTV